MQVSLREVVFHCKTSQFFVHPYIYIILQNYASQFFLRLVCAFNVSHMKREESRLNFERNAVMYSCTHMCFGFLLTNTQSRSSRGSYSEILTLRVINSVPWLPYMKMYFAIWLKIVIKIECYINHENINY